MGNLELNCKWHFAEHKGGREEGPNDPMQGNFKKTPYASLIRESIQNSLDVQLDESQPVKMEFSISRIRAREYNNFFQLKKHAEGCIQHFYDNEDAITTYKPIIDFFDSLGEYDNLYYIKVSDFNTRGMEYVKGNTSNPFYAFVRAAGVSAKKDATAGGSYGFGKAAYFYISPLRTIFVSTQTEYGEHFFEGVSSLCTHELKNEKGLFVPVGYYDNNEGEPITDITNIPARFRRDKTGTDIFIMGIDVSDRQGIYNEMIEAVLRNFWLAIYQEKLVVKIDNIEINRDNLQDIMSQHFDSDEDTKRREHDYNPKPYLDAVINAGRDKLHVMYEDNLPTLGNVRFYAVKSKHATDKVLYMRKPLMLVKARRTQSSNGFYGVFVCDDDNGNRLLRETENAAHNEWKSANWQVASKIQPEGREAINDVDNYIMTVIERMFANRGAATQNIQGLEEFLYIPTAVEEDEDFLEAESLVGEVVEQKEEEGNSVSTSLSELSQNETNDNSSIGKVMIEKAQSNYEKNSEGKLLGGHGTQKRKKKGGGGITAGKIDSRFTEAEGGVAGALLTEVPVNYRSFAQVENGKIIHNIVIRSDYEFSNGRIDLIVGGDQSDDVVTISKCSSGSVHGNTISGIHLVKGKNTLKIQFADNMRHAVRLDAYELK